MFNFLRKFARNIVNLNHVKIPPVNHTATQPPSHRYLPTLTFQIPTPQFPKYPPQNHPSPSPKNHPNHPTYLIPPLFEKSLGRIRHRGAHLRVPRLEISGDSAPYSYTGTHPSCAAALSGKRVLGPARGPLVSGGRQRRARFVSGAYIPTGTAVCAGSFRARARTPIGTHTGPRTSGGSRARSRPRRRASSLSAQTRGTSRRREL